MNDKSDLPILSQNVDQRQVPPIEQKRMVAFINHFIINTVSFLNEFMANVESKFIEFDSKLQTIESSLMIVEAKLASVPDVVQNQSKADTPNENEKVEDSVSKESPPTTENIPEATTVPPEQSPTGENNAPAEAASEPSAPEESAIVGVKACDDARYRKYFKMLQFGVPAPAVKLKMKAEGFDPDVLDEPNRILEDGIDSNVSEEAS